MIASFALSSLLAAACDDAAEIDTAPSPAPEGADVPEPEPPFDFRRAVLEPERHEGSTRSCVVSSVSRGAESDPNDPPEVTVARAHRVRCWHPHGVYEVRVLVTEDDLDLTPPSTPMQESARRVSLDLHGVDESGRRPIGVARESGIVEATLPPPPDVGASPTGFNFDLGPIRPANFGAEHSCAVRSVDVIERVGPERGLGDVTLVMQATCAHEDGRTRGDLHFTDETLEHALQVEPGAVVQGTLQPPRTLQVSSVEASTAASE